MSGRVMRGVCLWASAALALQACAGGDSSPAASGSDAATESSLPSWDGGSLAIEAQSPSEEAAASDAGSAADAISAADATTTVESDGSLDALLVGADAATAQAEDGAPSPDAQARVDGAAPNAPDGVTTLVDAGMDAASAQGADGADDGASAQGADGADDGPLVCHGPGAHFATDVVSYHFGAGQDFGRDQFPAIVLGPPKGGGTSSGSVNVVSIGNGGTVTVTFAGNAIIDGPGPDFLVFENAFNVNGDPTTPYAELASVEVSDDGEHWVAFPCTATSYPYGTCAGWHPVFANVDTNTLDPTDPAVAGGDPFDLATIGVSRARYVRVTDRPDDGMVFDLDAFAIVHGMCP